MAVSYKKLWKLLIDKDMTKTQMRIAADIAPGTLAKMNKDEPVSMDVMFRICNALNCEFNDIVDITTDKNY